MLMTLTLSPQKKCNHENLHTQRIINKQVMNNQNNACKVTETSVGISAD